MARIRSIHPGIWTDEAFMSISAYARLLYIGIWTEAYDDGVFEWKPLTLKARIFPVDNVDVPDLLVELFSAGLIARAETHPKQPGMIRNFQRFQRPKKPNSSGMLPDEWRDYVGAVETSSEPVPNQLPTSAEIPPQMEDGGGRMENESSDELSRPEPSKPAPVAVIGLPTVSDGDFPIFDADIADWSSAFPAVDVRQQLAAMRQWLIANPTRRKTKRGMRKFVVSWLDRRQNTGPSPQSGRQATAPPRKPSAFDAYDDIARMKGWTNEPACLPGNHEDAERLSSAGVGGHSGPSVDLRRGYDWHPGSGDR